MGELTHECLQAHTQLSLSKAACQQLELPVPAWCKTWSHTFLAVITQSCDPAVSNTGVEEPGGAASWILSCSDHAVVTGGK